MKIVTQKDWIYAKCKKVLSIGAIALPEASQIEKDDVEVLVVGPDVTFAKVGDSVIIRGGRIVIHVDPEIPNDEKRIFIKEEDVIALIKEGEK